MKKDAAGLTEVKPLVKYQFATISRAQESTYYKILNHGKSTKFGSQQTMKYRSGGHISCIFLLISLIYILKWNSNLLSLKGLEILPWTKRTEVRNQRTVKYILVMRPWLLYIPAGRIAMHPDMKYQLATINWYWDSSLDKNLNLDNLTINRY